VVLQRQRTNPPRDTAHAPLVGGATIAMAARTVPGLLGPKGKHLKHGLACAACERGRKKCDGLRPCTRCARLGKECVDGQAALRRLGKANGTASGSRQRPRKRPAEDTGGADLDLADYPVEAFAAGSIWPGDTASGAQLEHVGAGSDARAVTLATLAGPAVTVEEDIRRCRVVQSVGEALLQTARRAEEGGIALGGLHDGLASDGAAASTGPMASRVTVDTVFSADAAASRLSADSARFAMAAADAQNLAARTGLEISTPADLRAAMRRTSASLSGYERPRELVPAAVLQQLLPARPPRSLRPRLGLFDAPMCSPQGIAAWTELFTRALAAGKLVHMEEGVRNLLAATPGASERLGVPLVVRTMTGAPVRSGVLPPGHHPDHNCASLGIAAGGSRSAHHFPIDGSVPTGFDDVVESALAGTPVPVTRVVYDDVTGFPIR